MTAVISTVAPRVAKARFRSVVRVMVSGLL
jgi:hypothetical protein